MTMGSRGGVPTEDAMTAFSALHLLRNYNHLFTPAGGSFIPGYNPYTVGTSNIVEVHHVQRDSRFPGEWPPVLGAFQPYFPAPTNPALSETKGRVFLSSPLSPRRPRGEKKPIPDDQKDDRYYERRKRNNQAAKKSRDARKLREDQIALRAALLEHENAMLRAQIVTLREETQSLRQLLFMQGKVQAKAITASGDDEYKLSGLNDQKVKVFRYNPDRNKPKMSAIMDRVSAWNFRRKADCSIPWALLRYGGTIKYLLERWEPRLGK